VITDARRVRQILGNVVSNAIKYTPACGRIHVAVAPASAGGDRRGIAIDVADTGPGIPRDMLEEIFEEFSRPEPGAERGTGVGLTISRRITRALGGAITVESGGRKGSTFSFWVPLVPPSGTRATAETPAGLRTMD